MKTQALAAQAPRTTLLERAADFIALTKPRIAVMVLAAAAAGAWVAAAGRPDPVRLTWMLVGTALVAGGASVVNQLAERDVDARMRRTAQRPLPRGAVQPAEALWFGAVLALLGMAALAAFTNLLAAAVALASLVLYSIVYTPMKRWTPLNTAVGAVPGALPPVIGWAAERGELGPGAWALFGILFFWQFPHFFAIAWIHREDYAAGGLKMLPTSDLGRRLAGPLVLSYALALLPVSLAPAMLGLAGAVYFFGAIALGLQYVYYSAAFLWEPSDHRARRLLWGSLVYLPGVLALLVWDSMRLVG